MNLDMQEVAQNIHDDMALAALHLFAAIDASVVAVVLGFDAL
jgi:hypothetical protein